MDHQGKMTVLDDTCPLLTSLADLWRLAGGADARPAGCLRAGAGRGCAQGLAGGEARGADAALAAAGLVDGDVALQAGGQELLVGPGLGAAARTVIAMQTRTTSLPARVYDSSHAPAPLRAGPRLAIFRKIASACAYGSAAARA
jgi:hypothetical protein